MLDRDGYRPNVAIVVSNSKNLVFWGKRIREHSWQFPQGGINPGETPEQAMYRELKEEVGLEREDDPLAEAPHAGDRAARRVGDGRLDRAKHERTADPDPIQRPACDVPLQRLDVHRDIRKLGHSPGARPTPA